MPTVIELLFIDDNTDLVAAMKMFFELHKDDLPPFKFYSDTKSFFNALTPQVQICVIDYFLSGMNGLDIIKEVTKTNPHCWFIMFSGQKDLRIVADFMNSTQGSRYVEKGRDDSIDKLMFYIKDIVHRIKTIEGFYLQSFRNNASLMELKDRLNELKNTV